MLKGVTFIPWPVRKHAVYYLDHGVAVPALFLVAWVVLMNFHPGNPTPLPYIPLMNPLELSQIFILFVLSCYLFRDSRLKRDDPGITTLLDHLPAHSTTWALGAVLFLWINFVTGRVVHHYFDIPFTWHSLHRSVVFQAAISVLWSMSALGITVWATKTGRRRIWFCGAVLLGMVVLKLFTVDLDGTRTIARIISFLGVGSLMLVIGYFSPLPPKEE